MKLRLVAAIPFAVFALILTVILSALAPSLAVAQATPATTTVAVPVGDWLTDTAAFLGPLLAAVVLWMIRKLPPQVAALIMSFRVDQLLLKAIAFGVNSVKEATHDQPLTVNVGNEVLAKALDYAIRHGAPNIINWMGGEEKIREKIIARLNLDAKAALK